MINILVAEDQPLILQSLCNKIISVNKDYNIIATATNGKSALEKIIQYKPDIVLTDINMPLLSGLELIKEAKKLNISSKFVIISGYKDFEYAREAMKYKVDEYLLKPLSTEDIKILLDSLIEKISLNKSDYEKNLINKLIHSSEINKVNLNITFDYPNYYLLMINIGAFNNFSLDFFEDSSALIELLQLENYLNKFFNNKEKAFVLKGKTNNEIIIFIASKEEQSQTIENFSKELLLLASVKELILTIGVSKNIKNLNSLSITTQLLRTLIKNNLVFSKSKILKASKINLHHQNSRLFFNNDLEKKLKIYLSNNQWKEFFNEYNNLLASFEEKEATQFEIEKNLQALLNIHKLNTTFFTLSDIDLKFEEAISKSTNYNDLKFNLKIILEELFLIYTSNCKKENSMESIIHKIKDYIDSNLSEDINVNNLAIKFSISPTYFSRLFKKEIGVSPIAYITRLRVTKACELLKNSNFTIKEISELCGYSDQFYFSKAFKHIIGISPSDFK